MSDNNDESDARRAYILRQAMCAAMVVLGIAHFIFPAPWDMRATAAQMVVLAFALAPLASKALVEMVMGPVDAKAVRSSLVRLQEMQRSYETDRAEYHGWRVRILGVLRTMRAEFAGRALPKTVDNLDVIIRDLSAEVGPLPERSDAN